MKFSQTCYRVFAVTLLGFVLGTSPDSNKTETLSPSEKLAIKKFYTMVKDGFTQEIQHDEKYLIRWIRARDNDLNAAEEFLRQNFQWRKTYGTDSILDENFESWKKRSAFRFANDYEGRPALTAGLGQVDVRRIALAGEQAQLVRYLVYGMESEMYEIRDASNRTGKYFLDGYLIFSLAGYSSRSHACLACIPSWLSMIQNYEKYYPQMYRKIIIVNTPRVFQYILNIVRPFMSPHTAKVLQLYGLNREEWKRELIKIFPENNLSSAFGGTSEGSHNS